MSSLIRLTRTVVSSPVVARNLTQRALWPCGWGHMASGIQQLQPRVFMSSQVSSEHNLQQKEVGGVQAPVDISQQAADEALKPTRTGTIIFDKVAEEKSPSPETNTSLLDITPPAEDLVSKAAAIKWEAVPPVIKTGAILPFADLNFLQVIIFPYTYAVMYYLDFLHQHMPWWQSIVLTTATARLIFFPLVIKQNIIGIKTFNLLPETQKIQVRMNEALGRGDAYNQALERTKLQILFKEHGLSMMDRLKPILIQAPMFMSIFFLLRALTGIPAEGLSTGGAFWFTDLTVPDPYYILPIVTSTSMFLLFEFGMEGSMNPRQGMAPIGRYLIRTMPFLMFFFIQGFPAATLLFWSTNNIFTLCYALVLKNKWVKKKFNIPARLVHDPSSLPMTNMTFKGQLKEAIEKGKVKRTSMDIRRLDDISFRKAGVGPLRKTFKEPPQVS